jgi:Spy/CpxP family protein refolding chaperone
VSIVWLANVDEVQAALNLSDEQKKKVDEINDDFSAGLRELRERRGDRAEYRKLDEETSAKVAAVLDETQNKRLLGILAQVNVTSALNNSAIAKELDITDEQKKAIDEARQSSRDDMEKALEELQSQNLSREEIRTKRSELRADADKKLLAALTSEQQAQFEALKGEPVKIDMGRLFRGGRGDREGRGERRRDRSRDSDNEAAESDSADRGA